MKPTVLAPPPVVAVRHDVVDDDDRTMRSKSEGREMRERERRRRRKRETDTITLEGGTLAAGVEYSFVLHMDQL